MISGHNVTQKPKITVSQQKPNYPSLAGAERPSKPVFQLGWEKGSPGEKEIGHNLARERTKFGHNLVCKRQKIGHSLERERHLRANA